MLEICPMTLKEANAYVEQHHRHHKPVVGHKFSIGCSDGEKIVGVAIVGRPVARHLDDGWTLEVNRLCTDGTRNACPMLYAAAWRAARAMGYKRLVTYILESESGVSLKAAGWKCVGQAAELIEKLTDRCARYAEEIAVLQEREKWVPVTERLPEISNSWGVSDVVLCIISDPSGYLPPNPGLCVYLEDGKWTCHGRIVRVTHWRPLPDRPEVE